MTTLLKTSPDISRLAAHDHCQRVAVYFGIALSLVMLFCVLVYGTPAQSATGDADLDSVPDTVDIDDDNDGIPDRDEITPAGLDTDTDGDGVPDRLDLDSDNDGILDLEESGLFVLPVAVQLRYEGGRIRAKMGLNGFADLLETGQDNGQLAYRILNTDSKTGDTLPDFRDLDSDNDGLFDMLEAGIVSSLDANGDARIDALPGTVGADGILDSVQLEIDATCCDYNDDGSEDLTPRNTDGGDFPDFQDHDSDNDGIADLVEAGGRDLNGDGFVDGFIDDPRNPDGIDDAFLLAPLNPGDSNGNGVADYLDVHTQYTGNSSSAPLQPAESATEPAAEPLAAPAVANDDAGGGVVNDAIETGLAGNAGCSLVTNSESVDPLLPLTAMLAFGYTLSRRGKTRRSVPATQIVRPLRVAASDLYR